MSIIPHYQHCATKMGSAYVMDLKSIVRTALSDQAWLLVLLINDSVPMTHQTSSAIAQRLLKNPGDISKLITPIVGNDKAEDVMEALTEHLKLAAAMLPFVSSGTIGSFEGENSVSEFYEQGDEVADALSALNKTILPYETVRDAISIHNQYIVTLATSRYKGDSKLYLKTLDEYNQQFLSVADLLYTALHMAPHDY